MIQLLKSLLGEKTPDRSVRKPTSNATDFRAVSLTPSLICCAATKNAASKRLLWRQAPTLPLSACTMRSSCACKFRKHADRRDGERRLLGGNINKQWYIGGERRERQGRRVA